VSGKCSYPMEGHAKTKIADKVKCADCLNDILVGFADGMIYCPVCENYVYEVV